MFCRLGVGFKYNFKWNLIKFYYISAKFYFELILFGVL